MAAHADSTPVWPPTFGRPVSAATVPPTAQRMKRATSSSIMQEALGAGASADALHLRGRTGAARGGGAGDASDSSHGTSSDEATRIVCHAGSQVFLRQRQYSGIMRGFSSASLAYAGSTGALAGAPPSRSTTMSASSAGGYQSLRRFMQADGDSDEERGGGARNSSRAPSTGAHVAAPLSQVPAAVTWESLSAGAAEDAVRAGDSRLGIRITVHATQPRGRAGKRNSLITRRRGRSGGPDVMHGGGRDAASADSRAISIPGRHAGIAGAAASARRPPVGILKSSVSAASKPGALDGSMDASASILASSFVSDASFLEYGLDDNVVLSTSFPKPLGDPRMGMPNESPSMDWGLSRDVDPAWKAAAPPPSASTTDTRAESAVTAHETTLALAPPGPGVATRSMRGRLAGGVRRPSTTFALALPELGPMVVADYTPGWRDARPAPAQLVESAGSCCCYGAHSCAWCVRVSDGLTRGVLDIGGNDDALNTRLDMRLPYPGVVVPVHNIAPWLQLLTGSRAMSLHAAVGSGCRD
ncbi:hypothetical protein EON62_02395 [archaeon]|nr:MAG: hypothetical protein EON62_02395 [archaeon]